MKTLLRRAVLAIVVGIGVAGPTLPVASAADTGCTRCTTWAVNRALRAGRPVDCAGDVPRVLAARLERALARCRTRRACGPGVRGADVVTAVRAGVDAIEARICDASPAQDDADAPASDVLRIRCLADDRVEVLTPVVAARPDGLHIEALDAGPATEVGVRSIAMPNVEYWSGSSDAREPFVRPLHTGEARVWCIAGPLQSQTASVEAAFELVDPAGHFVPYTLDCPPVERRDLFFDLDLIEQGPSSSIEEAVRVSLDGLRPDDVVEQAGYAAGGGDWPWLVARVVRGGRVVAAIDVDGRDGWKYQASSAQVCADAGFLRRR